MNNDWLLLLAFWPSIVLVTCLYSVWKLWDHSKEEFEKIYQMGKRHGKEDLALKIYRDSILADYADEDEDDDETER